MDFLPQSSSLLKEVEQANANAILDTHYNTVYRFHLNVEVLK